MESLDTSMFDASMNRGERIRGKCLSRMNISERSSGKHGRTFEQVPARGVSRTTLTLKQSVSVVGAAKESIELGDLYPRVDVRCAASSGEQLFLTRKKLISRSPGSPETLKTKRAGLRAKLLNSSGLA